jgi:hypothetical protein
MTKYQKTFLGLSYTFIISLLVLILISSIIPAQTPPTMDITIELYSYNEPIDTSPEIDEPTVHVDGLVRLTSTTPMHIEVNLSIDDDWTVIVEPANFTLNVPITGMAEQPITVTIIAPLGIENNTEHYVSIGGTWSYIQGIGGGDLPPKELNLVAKNETSEPNDNGNGHGDDGGVVDDDDSFPMLEVGVVVIIIIIVVVIVVIYRRKKMFEEEEYYDDDDDDVDDEEDK